MPPISDVDLVLGDLEDALAELRAASASPKEVRQCLSRFIDLTQRLTAVMRKDWSARFGSAWIAGDFKGWNETTDLFKELRNQEQHEKQIYISVNETRHYEIFGPGGGTIACSGVWELSDQRADSPPDALRMYDSDPETGEKSSIEIIPSSVSYRYLLQAREDAVAAKLKALGTSDVHDLSNACMNVLREYHAFYRTRTDV